MCLVFEQEPFFAETRKLLEIIKSQRIEGYVAQATVAKFFYYAKNLRGEKYATEILSMVMEILKECPFDDTILEKKRLTLKLIEIADFEVAEGVLCTIANHLEAFVTLNSKKLNYMGSIFPVLSVKQVLDRQPLEDCFHLSEPIEDSLLFPEPIYEPKVETEMSVVPETDSNVERRLDKLEELYMKMNENLNQVLDQDPSSRKPRSSLSKGSKSARLRNLVKGEKSSVNPEIPSDSQFRD
ncbi:hypothetical protein BJP37_23745 [Moorena bouillonii PNG]|uniref:Uncharacterized protein n=2 Tax=Moorena TaxID=1155738 RepID=A0A1U7N6J7_9CYAN|nr:hypothetical protein BJP37_23745 [Moorena bouillonii PNG]